MELVVDANILVAGFLRSAITRELLLDERVTLYAPEYSIAETERVLTSPRIRRKLGNLSKDQIQSLLSQLTAKVRLLPQSAYRAQMPEAETLAPHSENALYLALALSLRLPIWSNDAALRVQRAVPVYTTKELLEIL